MSEDKIKYFCPECNYESSDGGRCPACGVTLEPGEDYNDDNLPEENSEEEE